MTFLSRCSEFHRLATEATGLKDFGPDDYHDAMERMLAGIDEFDGLNEIGCQMYEGLILGNLVGRLRVYEGLRQHPEVLETPIKAPLIITGLARSGTTVLYRTLVQDPQVQWLPNWLAGLPKPRTPRESWESDPDFQQVKQAFENSPYTNEELREIHPIAPELPDECRFAFDQSFAASAFCQIIGSGSYADWYHQADLRYAYRHYHKVLQLIANGDKRRWVLKDPSHVEDINGLLSVFPDAHIVQTHREPVECLHSTANLGWQILKIIQDKMDQESYGQMVLREWAVSMNGFEKARQQLGEERFLDVHMLETRRDPLGTLEKIFAYFDFPISDDSCNAWRRIIAKDPDLGHTGRHRPPDFGLEASAVNEAMGVYRERYVQVCKSKGIDLKYQTRN